MATETTDSTTEYRIELFSELGFTIKEAERLASARDADGFLVRPDWVQRNLLDKKVGHKRAVDLIVPGE